MMLKSLSGLCMALLHAVALGCGVLSTYFFFGSAVDVILIAVIMLGAAAAFEVIAAIVGDNWAAHS
jgi:hypothetical protein